jgi:hypothetical protein
MFVCDAVANLYDFFGQEMCGIERGFGDEREAGFGANALEWSTGRISDARFLGDCASLVIRSPPAGLFYILSAAFLAHFLICDPCHWFDGVQLEAGRARPLACAGGDQIGDLFMRTFGTAIEEGFCTRTVELDNTWGPLGAFGEITTASERLPFGKEGEGVVCTPPVLSIAASMEQHLGALLAKLLNNESVD